MTLAYALSDAFLARCVGHEALARGFVYAQSGAVIDVDIDLAGHTVTGVVQGSESKPYDVDVDLALQGKGLHYGTCSCYVGQNCKHVAAVLVRLRIVLAESKPGLGGSAEQPRVTLPPAWERSLDQILSSTRPPTLTRPDEIGLRVEPTHREPHKPLRLRARPVRRAHSGNWVQDGISWSLLEYDWDSRHEPTQRDLLVQLSRLGRAADRYTYYGRGDWVEFSDITRSVWSVLSDLTASGVALVPAGGRKSARVELAPSPAELRLDLHQTTLDGDLQLAPVIRVGPREPEHRRVGFVGHPAHGVVLESADASLLLAPLEGLLDHGVQEWLEQQHDLTIPAADRERFVSTFVPRLRRRVPLASSDGTVELPKLPRPLLTLAVAHGAAGEIDLSFAIRYDLADHQQSFPPQDRLDGSALRDLAAEDRVIERLKLGAGWPGLVDPAGRPQATARLLGRDAVRFCADTLPELIAAGIEVSQSGTERDYRRTDSAPQITFSTAEIEGVDAASDWFDLIVDVRMDGELVPFDQLFTALAVGEEFLITESGVCFDLDRPEFTQLLELITEAKSLQDRDRSSLRINLLSQSLWQDLVEAGSVGVQAARWQQAVRALSATSVPDDLAAPQGLKAELRPYQREGFAWLWQLWTLGIGGILADDMGLGKTVQALALICAAREQTARPAQGGGEHRAPPFLVVAPTSVVGNWASETARFAPGLHVVAVSASEKKRRESLAELVADADIVVTSYTLARIDVEHYAAIDWQGLFLDEAQFVKNFQAKTYTAIRRLGVDFTVAITGTPLENSLMDLWSMLSLTAPGMFPSPTRFTSFYRTPIERGEAPERLALLRQRIRPVMLRRTKDLVAAELPAKQEQVLQIDLHPRHARIYQTHLQRERQRVLGLIEELDENRITILSSLTLLRQLSLDAALIDSAHEAVTSAKVEVLLELLPELVAEGHRALVFSQFTSFLRRIGSRLQAAGLDYAYLDGSTRNRPEVIDGFRSGDAGVFLISLKAGGFGLNLTEADYCFVCDPWWNPAAEAQAVDRAHRIGQTRPVMVYRLVSKDTIEDKVMQLKARKEQLFSSVLSADGLPAGALTSEDIRGLLAS